MEPGAGIEPATCALRMRRSTVEPPGPDAKRRKIYYVSGRECQVEGGNGGYPSIMATKASTCRGSNWVPAAPRTMERASSRLRAGR